MTNIINFPKKQFKVYFKMPDGKIIKIRKRSTDKIKLQLSENGGFAIIEANNLNHAHDTVKRILPDSVIVSNIDASPY
jgi:hypothetical protein